MAGKSYLAKECVITLMKTMILIVKLLDITTYMDQKVHLMGEEKAPAALCRKIAKAKINNLKEIEIWGDGEQTRSFLYIDDCVDATLQLVSSNYNYPINIGSEEQVSINQMVDIIEEIADYKVNRKYIDGPLGVRGRNSDNELIEKVLKWKPSNNLKMGLEKTYRWIFKTLKENKNSEITKFSYF